MHLVGSARRKTKHPAPLIAIVGSDGSGKSTVGLALLAWMQTQRPTAFCHLGKQTGNIGRAIARLPFVGASADRKIVNVRFTEAASLQKHDPHDETIMSIEG